MGKSIFSHSGPCSRHPPVAAPARNSVVDNHDSTPLNWISLNVQELQLQLHLNIRRFEGWRKPCSETRSPGGFGRLRDGVRDFESNQGARPWQRHAAAIRPFSEPPEFVD